MRRIVLASQNPVKKWATLEAFQQIFPEDDFQITCMSVPSGVSEQPQSQTETLQGAYNRVSNARALDENADYWVGIEGGVAEIDGDIAVFAWVVVRSPELVGKSRSGMFFLPRQMRALVQQGMDMARADDIVFKTSGCAQHEGAIGRLTKRVITRTTFYVHAVALALVAFRNPELY